MKYIVVEINTGNDFYDQKYLGIEYIKSFKSKISAIKWIEKEKTRRRLAMNEYENKINTLIDEISLDHNSRIFQDAIRSIISIRDILESPYRSARYPEYDIPKPPKCIQRFILDVLKVPEENKL